MHLEKGDDLGRVDKGKFGVLTQSCTWKRELLKSRMLLKRTGADAGVVGVAVNVARSVEKVPTWSSPGKSNRSPLVPCVQRSGCHHLKTKTQLQLYERPKTMMYYIIMTVTIK